MSRYFQPFNMNITCYLLAILSASLYVFAFPESTAAQTLSVTPSSGQQNAVTFNYSGSGYTPNSTIRRFLTYPNGTVQEISTIPVNAQGQGAIPFPSTCNDAVGTYSVKWRDASTGRESNSVQTSITANPSCFPPSINSISPNQPMATKGNQNIIVNGANFQNGLSVSLTFPNGNIGSLSGTQIQNVTNNSFTMIIDFSGVAGNYSVRVNNPSGQQSNTYSFAVQLPAVTLTVSPSSGQQNAVTFNYGGNNYTPNGAIRRILTNPNGSVQELSQTTANSLGQGAIPFSSTCSDAVGNFSVKWIDAATGRESNSVQTTITANTACTAVPVVGSISPTSLIATKVDQNVVVNGSNFQSGLIVDLVFPDGKLGSLSGTQIQNVTGNSFTMVINFSGAPGNYSMRVKNPNGQLSNIFNFTAQPSPVTLSVTPTSGQQNAVTFTYSGSGYTSNGMIRRFLTTPNGTVQEISSTTADAQGQRTLPFPSTCNDAVGTYSVKWRDAATGRESNSVQTTITSNPACLSIPTAIISVSAQGQSAGNNQILTVTTASGGNVPVSCIVLPKV